MEPTDNLMPLSKFVAALRAELLAAHEDGLAAGNPDNAPRFVVGPVNIEFTLAARKEGGVNGGIRFYVFELGASGSKNTESTQRVNLTLTPVTKDGKPYNMSDVLSVIPK